MNGANELIMYWKLGKFENVIITISIITIFSIYLLVFFFLHQLTLMVFHRCLSDSKSSQVSRTLLSFLTVLNYVVDWMGSTGPPNSKSSSPFTNPFVTFPKAPSTMGINVAFMFHSFFQFPSKVEVLLLLFAFFKFYSVVSRDSKVGNCVFSIFFFFVDCY